MAPGRRPMVLVFEVRGRRRRLGRPGAEAPAGQVAIVPPVDRPAKATGVPCTPVRNELPRSSRWRSPSWCRSEVRRRPQPLRARPEGARRVRTCPKAPTTTSSPSSAGSATGARRRRRRSQGASVTVEDDAGEVLGEATSGADGTFVIDLPGTTLDHLGKTYVVKIDEESLPEDACARDPPAQRLGQPRHRPVGHLPRRPGRPSAATGFATQGTPAAPSAASCSRCCWPWPRSVCR